MLFFCGLAIVPFDGFLTFSAAFGVIPWRSHDLLYLSRTKTDRHLHKEAADFANQVLSLLYVLSED